MVAEAASGLVLEADRATGGAAARTHFALDLHD